MKNGSAGYSSSDGSGFCSKERPTMFETLMKYGGYRIDYINRNIARTPDAFGFYVRGDLPHNAAYSAVAKRHLVAGLDVIQREIGRNHLVAVYLDVIAHSSRQPAAYQQLLQDLRSGLFRRVFVYQSLDLFANADVRGDLENLTGEVDEIEIVFYDAGFLEKMILSKSSLLLMCDCERALE
jgi:hypothetical protein